MVKDVRREEADRFLRKAEEFYDSALENYQKVDTTPQYLIPRNK